MSCVLEEFETLSLLTFLTKIIRTRYNQKFFVFNIYVSEVGFRIVFFQPP